MRPLVSVIVPFFEHHSVLPRCLNSLSDQTHPRDKYEVIVVDNSREGEDLQLPAFPWVKLHREALAGSYAARNKGIAVAEGRILAFTDADCIPDGDWLEKGIARLLSIECEAVVAGRIALTYRRSNTPNVFELYDSLIGFRQHEYIGDHFGATANLFTTKAVFERAGLFDPRLKSSGDWEWGQRVHQCGIPQVYADEVVVCHPARASLAALARKQLRLAGGRADLANDASGFAGFYRDVVRETGVARSSLHLIGELRGLPRRNRGAMLAVLCILTSARTLERFRLRLGGTSRRS